MPVKKSSKIKVKSKRTLKNGAVAGYVYYSKEKKWKWRIIGRDKKQKGGVNKKYWFRVVQTRENIYKKFNNQTKINDVKSIISNHLNQNTKLIAGRNIMNGLKTLSNYQNNSISPIHVVLLNKKTNEETLNKYLPLYITFSKLMLCLTRAYFNTSCIFLTSFISKSFDTHFFWTLSVLSSSNVLLNSNSASFSKILS
jgi:hypothetical protein